MNILAIDSSSNILSIALETETQILHEEIDKVYGHSEYLMECADGLCKSAGIRPSDLTLVACMKGPGSFTGLRIGFSTAKGIAFALGIPLIAVPTLDCHAFAYSTRPGLVFPLLDAKKSSFFAAFYRGGKRLTDFFDETPRELLKIMSNIMTSVDEPVFLTGSGAKLFYFRLEESHSEDFNLIKNINLDNKFDSGRAIELLKLAKNDKLYMTSEINSAPVYLRKSDAELNCKKNE